MLNAIVIPTASAKSRSDVLARRLGCFAALSPEEIRLLQGLDAASRQHGPRTELRVAGERAPPRALISGWACREMVLSDGRRQILAFVLPGDIIGIGDDAIRGAPCAVVALTAGTTAEAEWVVRARWAGDGPHGLGAAVRGLAWYDEILLRDQVVRLGRQTAYERIAHLLLELHERLSAVGLSDGRRCPMPLTQESLADALGLSVVHVNRTVQQMRREGMIEWRAGALTLLRSDDLAAAADWTPTYRARSGTGEPGHPAHFARTNPLAPLVRKASP